MHTIRGPRPVTTTEADQSPAALGTPDRERRPWSLMVVLSVAQFVVILDATVVNVARARWRRGRLLSLHLVPRHKPRRRFVRELDLPGAALVVAGLVMLAYALAGAPAHGWGSARTLLLLALALALLAGFAAVERSARRPLVFPATSVTAMSGIAEDRAGVASGLMTTAHEIGAGLGVAVFSVVAVAADGGIAAGYRHGFTVAAAVAAGLAVVAAVAAPAVRPAAGDRVAVH
jgi:hypothetical protein